MILKNTNSLWLSRMFAFYFTFENGVIYGGILKADFFLT